VLNRQALCSNKGWGCKMAKYNDLLNNYCFQPVAIETNSVYSKYTTPFVSSLVKNLNMSGNTREWQCFHQCLSLALVRGNAASVLGVCKFDLILVIPNALASFAAHHLHSSCFLNVNVFCKFHCPLCSVISLNC